MKEKQEAFSILNRTICADMSHDVMDAMSNHGMTPSPELAWATLEVAVNLLTTMADPGLVRSVFELMMAQYGKVKAHPGGADA